MIGAETTVHNDPLRIVLGCLHGVLVFVGLEVALSNLNYGSSLMANINRAGNALNFTVLAALLAVGFPEREPKKSSWPLWEELLSPLGVGIAWGLGASLFDKESFSLYGAAVNSVIFLGVHSYVIAGTTIALLLFRPPQFATAGRLSLKDRLTSGMGLFWIILIVLWTIQAYFLLSQKFDRLFGTSFWNIVLGITLSSADIIRQVRHTKRKIHKE